MDITAVEYFGEIGRYRKNATVIDLLEEFGRIKWNEACEEQRKRCYESQVKNGIRVLKSRKQRY